MFISIVVLKSTFIYTVLREWGGGGEVWVRMYQEMGSYVGAFKDAKTSS